MKLFDELSILCAWKDRDCTSKEKGDLVLEK